MTPKKNGKIKTKQDEENKRRASVRWKWKSLTRKPKRCIMFHVVLSLFSIYYAGYLVAMVEGKTQREAPAVGKTPCCFIPPKKMLFLLFKNVHFISSFFFFLNFCSLFFFLFFFFFSSLRVSFIWFFYFFFFFFFFFLGAFEFFRPTVLSQLLAAAAILQFIISNTFCPASPLKKKSKEFDSASIYFISLGKMWGGGGRVDIDKKPPNVELIADVVFFVGFL